MHSLLNECCVLSVVLVCTCFLVPSLGHDTVAAPQLATIGKFSIVYTIVPFQFYNCTQPTDDEPGFH